MIPGIFMIAAVNIGMNWGFYPKLLKYQPGNYAGEFASNHMKFNFTYKNIIPDNQFYSLNGAGCHSLTFYAGRDVQPIYKDYLQDTLKKRDIWLYVENDDYKDLESYVRFGNTKSIILDKYPIQNLSFQFLNPETRNKAITHTYLIHLAKVDN